jgi:hypothetical protein
MFIDNLLFWNWSRETTVKNAFVPEVAMVNPDPYAEAALGLWRDG